MHNAEFIIINNVDIIVDDDNGRNIDRIDSLPDSQRIEESNNSIYENRYDNNDINIHIYRFKFIEELNNELYNFAKIHQYDHRKVFKEAWEIWLEENESIISKKAHVIITEKKAPKKKHSKKDVFILVFLKIYSHLWIITLKRDFYKIITSHQRGLMSFVRFILNY